MTVKHTVIVKNKLGMHARPAVKLFELVQRFDAEVMLRNESVVEAEASSVIAMVMLDSAQGKHIEVEANGTYEAAALTAMIELFKAGFDEE